jgi:hypothetical protein
VVQAPDIIAAKRTEIRLEGSATSRPESFVIHDTTFKGQCTMGDAEALPPPRWLLKKSN